MRYWRGMFKLWILARGQEHYERGQVSELKEFNAAVVAEVSGSSLLKICFIYQGTLHQKLDIQCCLCIISI